MTTDGTLMVFFLLKQQVLIQREALIWKTKRLVQQSVTSLINPGKIKPSYYFNLIVNETSYESVCNYASRCDHIRLVHLLLFSFLQLIWKQRHVSFMSERRQYARSNESHDRSLEMWQTCLMKTLQTEMFSREKCPLFDVEACSDRPNKHKRVQKRGDDEYARYIYSCYHLCTSHYHRNLSYLCTIYKLSYTAASQRLACIWSWKGRESLWETSR